MEAPKGKSKKSSQDVAKAGRRRLKAFIMWATTWMPAKWIQAIERFGQDDDELEKLDELLEGDPIAKFSRKTLR